MTAVLTKPKRSKSVAGDNTKQTEIARIQSMLDQAPVAVMFADREFKIQYMNKTSLDTLKTIEHLLPVKADAIIGQSVDIFHKRPEHQRNILSNPNNLPHSAMIQVGPETLDLLVSPVLDGSRNYLGAMVTWSVATEKLRMEAQLNVAKAMAAAIDRAQAVIEFDLDGTVITANDNFLDAMGYSLDEIKGKHHRMFVDAEFRASQDYKDLWANLNKGEAFGGEIRRIKKDGQDIWLQASYNPIMDANGKPCKVVKFGTDVTAQVRARDEMKRVLDLVNSNATTLGGSAEELTAVSTQMASNAEEASAQANIVSAAAEEVSTNVQTVATGVEEMNSAIREIAKNASDSARVAQQAVLDAQAADATVSKLGDSSSEIGKVIKVITSIAEQTNLLALNATIEAARAGEAGKGFAVVANEVKELAKETARATEDISLKIEAIQTDTAGAVTSIKQIGEVIGQINDISNTIASAVEEQTATAMEMSRNVGEAARGTSEIAQNITSVAQLAQNTSQGASNCQQAASELARMAYELQQLGGGTASGK